jgi:hypothetical protein
LTTGFVQWFRIATDDRGGFHFVPAFWSEVALTGHAMAPEAGPTAAASAKDLPEQPICATPVGQPA